MRKKRIAVIMGGPSKGHETSLKSGRNVLLNLDNNKYEGVPVAIDKEGNWEISLDNLKHHADIAFISMHGSYGEDGMVQSDLEERRIPYTGSDIHSSALGMNKFVSLDILKSKGFKIPRMRHIGWLEWLDSPELIIEELKLLIGFPMVIKPNRGSLGNEVVIIEDDFKLRSVLEKLFENNKDILIQEYVEGKEVVCGVYDHGIEGSAHPMVPMEVNRDLEDRVYTKELPEFIYKLIRKLAKDIHEILELRGVSLVDFILDRNGNLLVLEVNTIPELTKDSPFVTGANHFGLNLSDLITTIIESAERHHKNRG